MPLIQISLFEGRSDEQKKRLANKIMTACKEEFGSSEQYTWIMFQEKQTTDWFEGYESFSDIKAKQE